MATYILRLRDPRSLKLKAEIVNFVSATWTRRPADPGDWSLDIHADHIDQDAIKLGTIFDVLRDDVREFSGVICLREYDMVGRMWTLGGPDLTGYWLSSRVTHPGSVEFDTQSNVKAETAIKNYVKNNLTAPTDATRDVETELSVPFTVEGDALRGATVSYSARFESLLDVTVKLAKLGGLGHEVRIVGDTSYEYRTYLPRDLTGKVILAVENLESIEMGTYEQDCQALVNAAYVLGDGAGATRLVREVKNSSSITADFRHERAIDARQAQTNIQADDIGTLAVAQSILDLERVQAIPLSIGPFAYRTDWDLFDDVTVKITDLNVSTTRRIERVTVTLTKDKGETVAVALGQQPQSLGRILRERFGETKPAQFV